MSAIVAADSRGAARVGGWSLVVAAAGFVSAFGYLAARFDYPAVLDGAAADVLPRLLALGTTGRAVWAAYAFLPLLLLPAAVGAHAALRGAAPAVMRGALASGVVAAVSMLLGLARWPSVHWELARAYPAAGPDARVALDAVFAGLNVYLGNYVGEFLGELSLSAFFILTGVALRRAGRPWVGAGGLLAGAIGLAGAFRNVTPAVALIADANNVVLPVWLLVLGAALTRVTRPESRTSSRTRPPASAADR